MKLFFIFACCCILLITTGCIPKSNDVFVLDDSDATALDPELTWAVITDPYVSFQAEPTWTARVSGHARAGDYFVIIGNATVTSDDRTEQWYKVADGWLPLKAMTICNNKMLAESTAALYRKSS
ncbi:MAG: hypothetical protein K6E51_02235 [Treponema sp.]|nr:hypothetical protein [Treponema sp.]